MSTPAAPPQAHARHPLLWLVAIGFFMQTLDATIVNTALPAMAQSLGESPLQMQSVIVAYSLAMAMLIPASGWLADRFGVRPVYLGAIVAFVLGSVLCALAATLEWLVAARVLQGWGGALLLPVGRLAVLRSFPRAQFLHAMGLVTIPGLLGPLLGPSLGGWLVQVASWHWIFLINVPVGLVGLLASLRFMPHLRADSPPPLDMPGYLLLALGMVALSLGLESLGQRWELGLAWCAVGAASLALYLAHARRCQAPLFGPHLWRIASLRIGLWGNLLSRLGSTSMPFLVPLLLQLGLGYSPLQAGLWLLPMVAAGMAVKTLAVPLVRRWGYRRVLVGNTLALGLGMVSFVWLTAEQPLAWRLLQLAWFGAANSLQFSAMNTVTLQELDGSTASSGNSLLSMVQMLALGMGVALAGGLLAAFAGGHTEGAQVLPAFQATFVCMGLLTMAASAIFARLPHSPQAG